MTSFRSRLRTRDEFYTEHVRSPAICQVFFLNKFRPTMKRRKLGHDSTVLREWFFCSDSGLPRMEDRRRRLEENHLCSHDFPCTGDEKIIIADTLIFTKEPLIIAPWERRFVINSSTVWWHKTITKYHFRYINLKLEAWRKWLRKRFIKILTTIKINTSIPISLSKIGNFDGTLIN